MQDLHQGKRSAPPVCAGRFNAMISSGSGGGTPTNRRGTCYRLSDEVSDSSADAAS